MPLDHNSFQKLFKLVMEEAEFFEEGPPNIPWKDSTEQAREIREIANDILNKDARLLPLVYQEAYVKPLRSNIDLVIAQDKVNQTRPLRPLWDLETILGAIYDHTNEEVSSQLHQFLAVVSNIYRSFLDPEKDLPLKIATDKWLPPLAVFKHKMSLAQYDVSPYIVPADIIKKLFGGNTSVICLPSCYRNHPLLWTALAHEVGGHDVLHAYDGLTRELQDGVYQLIRSTKLTKNPELLAKLWRYWTEETACDVFAVMDMGPSYGLSIALYHAALSQSIRRFLALEEFMEKQFSEYDRQAWRTHGPKRCFKEIRKFGEFDEFAKKYSVDELSLRCWSGLPPEFRGKGKIEDLERDGLISDLDPHPVDILKLYIIIGAIQGLQELKTPLYDYNGLLKSIASLCGGTEKTVRICGYIQNDFDTWELVDETDLPLNEMQESACMVGKYLAQQATPRSLWGNIQAYETWTDDDEKTAEKIRDALMNAYSVDSMGDDTQLLAGATLAAFEQPEALRYSEISRDLGKALEKSFDRDLFWGSYSVVHPVFTWPAGPYFDRINRRRNY